MRKILGYLFSEYLFSGCKDYALGLLRKQTDRAYGKSVLFLRTVFLELAGIGLALLLASWGFILLPLAVLLYTPWEWTVKVLVCLGIGLFYLFLAFLLFRRIFSEKKWMKTFNVQEFEA